MSEVPRPIGRVALVTGASRGIGRAAALALAAAGLHVIALARTQGGLEELDDEASALAPDGELPFTLVPCDIKDFAALDRLGEAIFRRWGRLDVLVGNAGVLGPITPLHHVDVRAWDESSPSISPPIGGLSAPSIRCCALPPQAASFFVTSNIASRADTRAYWGPYAATKAGLDALARTYAAETENTTNIKSDARKSRPHANAHARGRDAGRGPRDPAAAGGVGAKARRDMFARVERDRQAL